MGASPTVDTVRRREEKLSPQGALMMVRALTS